MSHRVILGIVIAGWWACFSNADAGDPSTAPNPTTPQTSETKPPIPSRAELEKQFQETLAGATLKGTWQMTGEGGLTGHAPLIAAQEETYTIGNVTKGVQDYWMIQARIRFADKDVTVPVPVRVVWAEGTPIITVNDVFIPGVGTYSARVMIFKDFYAGTWCSDSKNYGGVMSGRITRLTTPEPVVPAAPSTPKKD